MILYQAAPADQKPDPWASLSGAGEGGRGAEGTLQVLFAIWFFVSGLSFKHLLGELRPWCIATLVRIAEGSNGQGFKAGFSSAEPESKVEG